MCHDKKVEEDIEVILENQNDPVHLEKGESGLVLRNDGSVELILPWKEEDDLVGERELILLAIVRKLGDQEWVDDMIEFITSIIEKEMAGDVDESVKADPV